MNMTGKILFILGFFLFLVTASFPRTILAEEKQYDFKSMTTYEMFWPVVPGQIPGDKFYNLKVWRDKAIGFLFFSGLKKAEYFKQIANKRLVESERLLEMKRINYFPQTLKNSLENLEKGLHLLSSAAPSQPQQWLEEEYLKDLQKYLVVLERMKEKAGGDQKQLIEESTQKVKSSLDSLI